MNIWENIATYFGFYEPSSGFDLKDWIYNLQCLKMANLINIKMLIKDIKKWKWDINMHYITLNINVLTYNKHKIWLEKCKYHSNIYTTIQKIQYTTYSPIELYIATNHAKKNHQWGTFTLSISYLDYTKLATPTMIPMLCFLNVYISFSYFNVFY
jgi:hypothetical protein